MMNDFPYRARAMFAFEEQDGVDVCFFGMHVQVSENINNEDKHFINDLICRNMEVNVPSLTPGGSTWLILTQSISSSQDTSELQFIMKYCWVCQFNLNSITIENGNRNDILPGYLDYMKKLGYTMAHIWACPPSEGDDYIFHSHPPDQKIPKPKRLQEWYKKMLDKGIIERIVLDYKDIYKQALEDNIQSPAELPYFEGDFWPNVMEENIRELEQEEEVRKRVSKRQCFLFLGSYFP